MPRHRFQTTDGYSWQRLAELVYEDRPADLARLAVDTALQREGSMSTLHDEAKNLLRAAVSSAASAEKREIFLKVLGPALEQQPAILWNLDDVLNPFLLGLFDTAIVIEGLEDDIDKRLPAVARSVATVRRKPE
jgi:hypothetical protein